MPRIGSMKSRELLRMALEGGGVILRNQGDDALVKFPNGRTARIPQGGKQNEAAKSLVCKIHRYLSKSENSGE